MIVYGSFAVLSDTAKRLDYDLTGNYEIDKYTLPVWSSIVNLFNFVLFYLGRVWFFCNAC